MADPASLTIRDYVGPGDLAPLVGLVRHLQAHEAALYDRMLPPAGIGAWYVDHLLAQCRAHAGRLLVAEKGGYLVGYATILARMEEDAVDEVAHRYAYVGDLAVAEEARGQGVARALLAACEAEARRQGARHLRVTVLAANARARDVYQAFGFRDLFVDLEKPLIEKDENPCD